MTALPASHDGSKAAKAPKWRISVGPAGTVYAFITLLMAIGAFNSQNNFLFWFFGFGLSLLLVSGVISRAMIQHVTVTRRPVVPLRVGETGRIAYSVRNNSGWMASMGLKVEEIGFTGAPLKTEAFVEHVPRRGERLAEAVVKPTARGIIQLKTVRIGLSYPFGLIRKSLDFGLQARVLVRPEAIKVSAESIGLRSQGWTEGDIENRSGDGLEFFSLREATGRDSVRNIAWRASAKRGMLIARQNAKPSPRRVWIVLSIDDTAPKDTAERAISVTAGAIETAGGFGASVGLVLPRKSGWSVIRPAEGRRQTDRLLDLLAILDLNESLDTGLPLPREVAEQTGVTIVVSAGERGGSRNHIATSLLRSEAYTPAGEALQINSSAQALTNKAGI